MNLTNSTEILTRLSETISITPQRKSIWDHSCPFLRLITLTRLENPFPRSILLIVEISPISAQRYQAYADIHALIYTGCAKYLRTYFAGLNRRGPKTDKDIQQILTFLFLFQNYQEYERSETENKMPGYAHVINRQHHWLWDRWLLDNGQVNRKKKMVTTHFHRPSSRC